LSGTVRTCKTQNAHQHLLTLLGPTKKSPPAPKKSRKKSSRKRKK